MNLLIIKMEKTSMSHIHVQGGFKRDLECQLYWYLHTLNLRNKHHILAY